MRVLGGRPWQSFFAAQQAARGATHLGELHAVDAQARQAVGIADALRLQAHQRKDALQQVLIRQPPRASAGP
jgi:hypothetical protein